MNERIITLKNGNTAIVKRAKDYHYYIAIYKYNKRISAWRRTNKTIIQMIEKI